MYTYLDYPGIEMSRDDIVMAELSSPPLQATNEDAGGQDSVVAPEYSQSNDNYHPDDEGRKRSE